MQCVINIGLVGDKWTLSLKEYDSSNYLKSILHLLQKLFSSWDVLCQIIINQQAVHHLGLSSTCTLRHKHSYANISPSYAMVIMKPKMIFWRIILWCLFPSPYLLEHFMCALVALTLECSFMWLTLHVTSLKSPLMCSKMSPRWRTSQFIEVKYFEKWVKRENL